MYYERTVRLDLLFQRKCMVFAMLTAEIVDGASVDIQFLGVVAQRACCLCQHVDSCTVAHLRSIKGRCYAWRHDVYQAMLCSFWLAGATGAAVGASSWATDRSAAAAAAR